MHETERHELCEATRLFLHVAQQHQVTHPVRFPFGVTVHHRRGRANAEAMRRLDDIKPLIDSQLDALDLMPHLIVQDFCRCAGQGAETGVFQHP